MPEPFPQRLERLRRNKGLSQREIAAPGVTYAYVSRLENGTRTPSLKAIRALAVKLDVTPLYLETGQEDYCPHCQQRRVDVHNDAR